MEDKNEINRLQYPCVSASQVKREKENIAVVGEGRGAENESKRKNCECCKRPDLVKQVCLRSNRTTIKISFTAYWRFHSFFVSMSMSAYFFPTHSLTHSIPRRFSSTSDLILRSTLFSFLFVFFSSSQTL